MSVTGQLFLLTKFTKNKFSGIDKKKKKKENRNFGLKF